MVEQTLTSSVADQPFPIVSGRMSRNSASADAGAVSRGAGRYIEKLFPHLLKNNFNKILLVDADPNIHIALDETLKNSGYSVQHAISEFDALQIIKDCVPDFLLINWEKPTVSGLQVYEMLRHTFREQYLYVIVLTSENLVRDKVQMVSAGADAFMVKPIHPGELLSQLQAGTRIIEQHLELKKLAMHDPLTGLLSRQPFAELQEQEWSRAVLHRYPLACAMIDLDAFQRINEKYGHARGDRILKRVGEILKNSARECDLLCRHGGDEFCGLFTSTDLQGALACCERFRTSVEKERLLEPDENAFPTATIGVAEKTGDTPDAEAMFRQAEKALIAGKEHGGNVVSAYNEPAAAFAMFPKIPVVQRWNDK